MKLKTYTRKTQTGNVAEDKLLIKKRDGRERGKGGDLERIK